MKLGFDLFLDLVDLGGTQWGNLGQAQVLCVTYTRKQVGSLTIQVGSLTIESELFRNGHTIATLRLSKLPGTMNSDIFSGSLAHLGYVTSWFLAFLRLNVRIGA